MLAIHRVCSIEHEAVNGLIETPPLSLAGNRSGGGHLNKMDLVNLFFDREGKRSAGGPAKQGIKKLWPKAHAKIQNALVFLRFHAHQQM